MRIALALFPLAVSGCSIGLGSPYVGTWRQRHQVDVKACLVDAADHCSDHKQIVSIHPAHSYWGAILPFAVGATRITHDGETSVMPRVEPSLEILHGNGGIAEGIRGSILFDGDVVAFPITAIGHVSLTDRFSLYTGLGYSPYAELRDGRADLIVIERTHLGGRVLAGLQLALSRNVIFSIETDALWLDLGSGYRTLGLTGHLGLFL